MGGPDWYYDDLRQVGVDFESETMVADYDRRQGNSEDTADALLDRIGLRPGDEIADVGCGTGQFACVAARRCRKVHAIDVSAAMLAAGRRRADDLALSNVTFHHAGFLSFAVDDESLDLVTTSFAFHHLPDFWKAIALERMRKALKPGGRLFLKDVVFSCAPVDLPGAVERWADWMVANTGYSRDEVACHVREEHSTLSWIMEGLIERSGFRLLSATYEREVYAEFLAERPET